MLNNFGNCQAMGMTTVALGFGASTFTEILPLKNQIGIALYAGTTLIEIAGAGASYPAANATFSGMNSNGSALALVANGSGLPVYNTIQAPFCISGAPHLWLSVGTTNLSVRVAYFFNDAFGNV